ncbi:hypothetical protein [Actinoplanes cyaneus]|uniref:hypothetical protein n=1 Tax=Actinoplanes cyaneus TaxID=52696 RepID=UPI0019449A06|nr:hypothetical protein [Actinoplanes cyaneus]MCW2136386.1 hypothetical protein [Actinoplanes cyaneus]
MTETSPAQPLTAPRRRRPIVVALGVLLVVVVALAAWIWARPPSPTAERDLALRGALASGGPSGWELVADPGLDTSDDAEWTQQDGRPVLLGGNGFTLVWAMSPAGPQACAALADWAARRFAAEAGKGVTDSCPAALASKSDDDKVFTDYGTEPGPHGRYLFSARTRAGAIFAGLTYEGPARNALR